MDIVEDIMTEKIVTCKPTTDILETYYLMLKNRIGRVVIVSKKGKPEGIITQKDVTNFLVTDKTKRELNKIKAKEVMSTNLITVKPTASISKVAKIMTERKISSLVVVDEDDILKGLATKADLIMYFANKGAGLYRVKDFMMPNPITVKPSHSIFQASSLMSENEISRLIVINEKSKPIGIVTLTDAIPMLAIQKKIRFLTVKDVMTTNPIMINKNSDLTEAAKLMTRHGISGLPVLDNFGDLTGIITKSDLVRAIATQQE